MSADAHTDLHVAQRPSGLGLVGGSAFRANSLQSLLALVNTGQMSSNEFLSGLAQGTLLQSITRQSNA
jgi:hypothetical protein